MKIETAAHLREYFPEMPSSATDLMVRATAPRRNALRVSQAQAAALDAACLDQDQHFTPSYLGWAIFTSLLDANGVGGPLGCGGGSRLCATTRHPAFQHLGSGRRHAADGSAWDAAIQSVLRWSPEWAARAYQRVILTASTDADGDPAIVLTLFMEGDDEAVPFSLDVTPYAAPADGVEDPDLPWVTALVGQIICQQAGDLVMYGDPTKKGYFLVHITDEVAVEARGGMEDWGRLYAYLKGLGEQE